MSDDGAVWVEMRGRWMALGRRVGVELSAEVFEELMGQYGEAGRAYHNVEHLRHCLAELEGWPGARMVRVELALWFHDAIYDPRRSDNEERSAALARERLGGVVGEEAIAAVERLILATRHKELPTGEEEQVIVDVDLAILGQPAARFDAYERAIRTEYGHVPEELFRKGRAAVLRSFLAREAIYSAGHFREKYEAAARENLRRSIAARGGGI